MEENKKNTVPDAYTQGDSVNDYYLALKKIEEEKEAKKKERKKKKRIGCGTAILVLMLILIVNAISESIPDTIACASCTDGYQPCSSCNEGKVTCTDCNGEKILECNNCDEKGNKKCYTCGGSGKTASKCSYCGGNGKISLDCDNCNGRGWVHNYTVDVLGEDVVCMRCNGSGKQEAIDCIFCSGDGISSDKEECKKCKGSGYTDEACYECNRTKKAKCSYCSETGYIDCPDCKGKQKTICKVCNGSAKKSK